MTTLPPADDFTRDTEQLKMLSIFWYVISCIQILAGCWAFFPISCGVVAFLGGASSGRAEDAAAGGIAGLIFGLIGLFILFVGWGAAILNFTVARSLPKREKRGLCTAMAVIECLFFPLGTILGVLTLIVLSRPSVKAASV